MTRSRSADSRSSIWSFTKRRTDAYGGDLASRTRFAVEVVAAVRGAVSPGFFTSLSGGGVGATGINGLLDRLESDEFDLVAVGRPLLADPAWADKILAGREHEVTAFTPAALGVLS